MAGQFAAIPQAQVAVGVLDPDRLGRLGGEDLDAEAARLVQRAPGEVGAAESAGEAEVVLDPRALPGLPAGRVALDHQRLQPLGGSVDRGGQAGRAAADDDQVVEGQLRLRLEADLLGDRDVGWVGQVGTVREEEQREGGSLNPGQLHQLVGLGAALDVQPPVGHLVARQEVLDRVGLG